MRESALERLLVSEVEKIGGRAVKWVSPSHRGVPDRIVLLPNSRTVYVEMKTQGKPLQPLQKKWFRVLQSLGHEVYKLDSTQSIAQFISEQKKRGDAK